MGSFTVVDEQYRTAARAAHGDKIGTQMLVEVRLLHRQHPHAHAIAGLQAALSVGR